RVVETVHHTGDATVLERLGDRLPAVLNELRRVTLVDALFDHLVETKDRARLEHAAENRLLTHEVGLHLGNKRTLEHASSIAAGRSCVSLGNFETVAVWIVLGVHSDQRRNAESTLVFLTH